ncbi:acyl-CoA dehydrogenase [Acuticoccus sp. M5D2P5]|uniref:acyl-CoA dehydrogenase family protein n=1 Tax=Acuticoccus kalidii TaxID=2910977 RepID=UPI001F234E4C|nr:acyl-CoA dehydrogenase family protein [Acuticoccus kalidii]MCF3934552.1 acyl-CoA dehydrogenase [Acuticoccus kalidii]
MTEALPADVFDTIAASAGAAETRLDLSEELALLRAHGILRAPLPMADGGDGLGTAPDGALACLALLRELGAANLSLARLVEGHINAVKLIALYGASEAREPAFEAVRAGALLGVWGADGASPARLRADGDRFVLAGGKRYASGLGSVTLALVTAAMEDQEGPQLVLVPADDPARADPAAWRQSGMRATLSGTYDLEGLPVAVEARIGEPGDFLREPAFEGGVWRYCAAHLGGAEALYGLLVQALRRRGRANDPHQERRISDAARACETARLWIESAARRVEAEGTCPDPEGAAAYALMAREATEEACLTVIDRVERGLGMMAFEHGDIERIRRDLSLFLRQAAPDAKRARIARFLVADDPDGAGARPERERR